MRPDFGVNQCNQRFYHAESNTGEAARKAVYLQHHNQAHQRVIQCFAHACRMRQHQRTLQVLQIVIRDARLRQQAKTRVNAVGRTSLGDNRVNASHAGVNTINGAGIEAQFNRLLPDLAQL